MARPAASKQALGRHSPRTDKEWTERAILAQSPVWMLAVALVMLTGALRQWDDRGYLLFSLAAMAPSVLLPAVLAPAPPGPWTRRYWVKLHAWVAIVVCFGTYFGTDYFFDLMGMRYAFDVRWNFSSDVLGQSGQRVPVFMYPLTHAYFMTYFVVLTVAEREMVRRLALGPAGRLSAAALLSYALAYAETFFMASSLLSDLFQYQDRARMLRVGSFGYAAYFIVGLPMVRRIDANGDVWPLGRVVIEALATCMMILVLLEAWAKLVGPL